MPGGRRHGGHEAQGAAAKPRMWLADTAEAAAQFAEGAKAVMKLAASPQSPLGEQISALRRKAAAQGRQQRSSKRDLARARERLAAAARALGEKEAEAERAERARRRLAERLEASRRELAAAAAALRERDAIIEGLRSRVGGKEAEAEPEGEAEVTLVQSAARPERVLRELAAAAGALESGGSPAPSSPQERAALPAPAASAAQPPARPASPHCCSPAPRPPFRTERLTAPVRRLSGAGRVVVGERGFQCHGVPTSEGTDGGAASAASEGAAPAAPLECSPQPRRPAPGRTSWVVPRPPPAATDLAAPAAAPPARLCRPARAAGPPPRPPSPLPASGRRRPTLLSGSTSSPTVWPATPATRGPPCAGVLRTGGCAWRCPG
eukprot:TRINITY_DN14658_c0_g1_i4.p2 TRINITY_DN14658_c0_g1~~TRINITY_DN14658_c0_g1_i4.p2  ORF type:complete len:404 (+),score=74.04 TRINITY_DN14658_c0_g1_i4:74-1213(+)